MKETNWNVCIETKYRGPKSPIDITKPQAEMSHIISVFDECWDDYHCLTSEYLKYADTTSYYLKHQEGKYKRISWSKFIEIGTTNLKEILDPLIEQSEPVPSLSRFFS